MGSAIVPELLRDPDLRLILLLRPSSQRSTLERWEGLKTYWAGYGLGEAAWRRVDVVEGDVGKDRLGLTPEDYRRVANDATHIVHAAAQVKLNMSREEAHRSSVATTLHVLRLARDARSLAKLEYFSTVGVAGTMEGAVPERRISENRAFHNTYESSKAEAEDKVWDAMAAGVPVTVHRPSMVVGDSRSGRTPHFQGFYHLMEFLSGRVTGGWVPRLPRFRLDVVTNDYVARAVNASLQRPSWAGKVLHLSAGRAGSLALDEYVEALPGFFSRAGLSTPAARRFPWLLFRALVPPASLFGPANRRKAFRHLPRFLSYLKEETYFENRITRGLLDGAGVPLPEIRASLAPVLAYYVRSRAGTTREEG